MQKQRLILVAGLILALAAAFSVNVYLNKQKKIYQEEAGRLAAKKQENQAAVLVARQEIPKGASITSEMLDTKILPREYVAPQAISSLDRVSGMVTVVPIAKDEQITLTKLSYPRQAGGLAEVTPVGKRAITINTDSLSSVAGMIRPGDYVDLIATLPVPVQLPGGKQATQAASVPLFQNVLVLAVGQEMGTVSQAEAGGRYGKGEQKREPYSLITLALNPEEANLVAFVQEQGKFRMILRSPADSQTQPLRPASWETLFQYVMPKEIEQAKPETEEFIEPTGYVEIYRGLKKEKVPLSK